MTGRVNRADYTALSERMGNLLLLRFAFAAIVIAWAALRPESLGSSFALLLSVTGGYAAASVLFEWARRRAGGGRWGFALLSVMLLVDGVYLAYAMYVTGGTQSPMRFLAYLHLVAVSLLASYRTGLKIALWHSLLLFVVLYAQAAQLLPAVDVVPGRAVEFDRMPVLNVTSFWLFALATSIFSAMNERELRQRRTDLQALVDLGARLDDVSDPRQQASIALDGITARFGFPRGLVLGASNGQVVILAATGTPEPPTAPSEADAIVCAAWLRKEVLPVKRLDAVRNPLLAAVLPGARNLLVAPMVADGRPVGAIVVEHRSRTVLGIERRIAAVLAQFASVAALNLRNAVLLRHVQDLAERDSLTGAANRHMFQRVLGQVLSPDATRDRPPDAITAVLFIDLDDFKIVNDTLGHAAGDALLVSVTERISASVRQGDLVARLGGDEFAVLIQDDAELTRSRSMADRLISELRAPYHLGDHHVTVTVSIGIASARALAETVTDVVRNADVAMYMAKANGKAGYAIFDPEMHAAIRERHEIGVELQRAVDLDQLRLVYQPIVELSAGGLVGVEALVRWQHPERGPIAPDSFIEIAEENGAILPIGRWVMREACSHAASWLRERTAPAELFLCVNVSAREIQQPGFVTSVDEALRDAGLRPTALVLEITETALLTANPSTVATLEALRRLGVRVVIDDFGTGYFSLSHLRQFPVDALKIASEFVQVADSDSRSSALAGAVVALSQSLGIATVAEGIESADQADRMRSLGCTYAQGFFFAEPMIAREMEAYFSAEAGAERGATGARRARHSSPRPSAA